VSFRGFGQVVKILYYLVILDLLVEFVHLTLQMKDFLVETDLLPDVGDEHLELSVAILEEPLIIMNFIVDIFITIVKCFLSQ